MVSVLCVLLHVICIYTQGTKVLKRLGGQDLEASVDKNFSQKYNNEFLRTLPSNHCAYSHRRVYAGLPPHQGKETDF